MAPPGRIARALAQRADLVAVLVLATWLVWPVPLAMPLSQDHTVHLARAYLLGQSLADGHISGWTSSWYFGAPVGELYPVLGDLLVVALRAASLTALPWTSCYALAFWLGYATIGLALVGFARATGLGRWTGVIAAALCLLDPGTGREGGWRFTVFFGVWMHPLAVALGWWAIGELAALVQASELRARRLLRPSLLLGASLLAHPGALPMIAVSLPIVIVCAAPRGRLVRAVALAGLVTALGTMLAAWWYAPVFAHRAWMAHFGTLWLELDELLGWLAHGQWAKQMPPAVGWTITLGLVFALVRGPWLARGVALASIALWLLASVDAFARLRLDLLGDGFRYLQYQRFVICAKPGLMLCAAWLLTQTVTWLHARIAGAADRPHRLGFAALALLPCAWIAWIVQGSQAAVRDDQVGVMQSTRAGDDDLAFEDEWAAYLEWAAQQWRAREGFWRFAYATKARHGHGLADAPLYTGAPAYKIGFTPGDNFIHRIESDDATVLTRARVRYLVAVDGRPGKPVASFGRIRVLERAVTEQVARLEGAGELTVVVDDPDGEGVVIDVRGSDGGRIEWNIAGYPRWELRHDGEPVSWYEVPILGDAAAVTPAERRAKAVPARAGDVASPRDPVLLAADAADGRWELRYRHVVAADVIGWGATLVAVVVLGWSWRREHDADRLLARTLAGVRGWMLVLLVLVVVGAALLRWQHGWRRETWLASGWLRAGAATETAGVRVAPLMVEHEIGPSIRIEAGPERPATIVFPGVPAQGRELQGWFAIDDPEVRLLRGELAVVISTRAADAAWVEAGRVPLKRRPGRQPIAVRLPDAPAVELRIEVVASAATPRAGFDLQLDAAPP